MSSDTTTTASVKELVIWLVLDKTGSMHNFGTACKDAFPEILPLISVLGAGNASIRLVAYGDYDEPDRVVQMSGPNEVAEALLGTIEIRGGGDYPEACKTALYRILREIKAEDASLTTADASEAHEDAESPDASPKAHQKRQYTREHVLFLFTDACPHYSLDGPLSSSKRHYEAEEEALGRNFDWLHLCRCVASRRISTVTFLPSHCLDACSPFYSVLGPLVVLPDTTPAAINAAIMSVFLTMMREDPPAPVAIHQGPFTASKRHEAAWRAQMNGITTCMLLPRARATQLSVEESTTALQESAPQVAEVLAATLPKLPKMLKADAALRAVAVAQLAKLATPGRVRALMINPTLGKVWRAVAAFRRHDENVAWLCDAFGAAVQHDAEMRVWVQSTYNMQDEIDEVLNSCKATDRYLLSPTPPAAAAFPKPTLRQTLDLLRGAFTAEVAGGVLEALRGVTVSSFAPVATASPASKDSKEPQTWTSEDGIPVDIPDAQLFSVLLHLMHPGTMASARAAAMVAVFALVAAPSGVLARRALQWLGCDRMKGKWTGVNDWETYPEVFSVQFILLMRRAEVQELLTSEEAAFFERLWYVWRLQRTRTCMLRVRTAEQLEKKPVVRPDHRSACRRCKCSRPLSLTIKGTCVFCVFDMKDVEVPKFAADGKSHMAQCRVKTCRAMYAVERPEQLLCEPKCHFCREGQEVPLLECSVCRARHVVPDAPGMHRQVKAQWVCAPCGAAEAGDSSILREARLEDMVRENEGLLEALECSVPLEALDKKLVAVFRNHDGDIGFRPSKDAVVLTWRGAAVLNCAEVCAQVRHVVRHAEISDLCDLCCMSRPLVALGTACGACDVRICGDCRRRWYEVAPGTLPLPQARLSCPFCRRAPSPRVAFCGRRNLPREIRLEERMIHGFCRVCRVIKGAAAQECVHGDVPEVKDWACADCRLREAETAAAAEEAAEAACAEAGRVAAAAEEEERRAGMHAARMRGGISGQAREAHAAMRGVKKCPGCGYGTEKAGGCNHITCTLCAAHWCWRCEGEFTEDTIYDHLEEVCGMGI